MSPTSSDPFLAPAPVLAARPLIESFARSARCPDEHRYHAASTLGLLVLFVSMSDSPDSRGLPWHRLSPDDLISASLDADTPDMGFLRDVLDLSAAFYGYLADRGVLQRAEAFTIQLRLVELALGFANGSG